MTVQFMFQKALPLKMTQLLPHKNKSFMYSVYPSNETLMYDLCSEQFVPANEI